MCNFSIGGNPSPADSAMLPAECAALKYFLQQGTMACFFNFSLLDEDGADPFGSPVKREISIGYRHGNSHRLTLFSAQGSVIFI